MRAWSRALLAGGIAAACVVALAQRARSQQPSASDPVAEIAAAVEDGIRARGSLHNSRVGVSVVDVATGRELYSRDPDGSYNVASNAKLVTIAAALALLGPDYTYQTSVYADAVDDAGVVQGDLVLVGRGDPSVDTEALRMLAADLQLAGVTRVTGGLVLDDTYFDDETMPPHFDEQPDEQGSFRAPVGALSLNFNAVNVLVRPGRTAGSPAIFALDPPNNYVVITGGVTTVRSGRTRLSVKTTEKKDALELRIIGQIRLDARTRRIRRRIADPFLYVGTAFRRALEDRGIKLGRRKLTRGPAAPTATALATYRSPQLSTLLQGLGKYSNNFVAEMVFKTIGAESLDPLRPATWADAQAAVKQFLVDQIGLAPDSFRIDNGSGLFDSNALTPRQLTTVLAAAYRDFRYGPEMVASLALGGADGTLDERMVDGPGERQVRAKTGTLDHVSTLSGYVAIDGITPLAFSVVVNDVPKVRGATGDARSLQDDVAESLVVYLRSMASQK